MCSDVIKIFTINNHIEQHDDVEHHHQHFFEKKK